MCTNPNTRLLMRLIVDILLLSAIYCVALLILPQMLHTRQRGFFCGDETIAYPFKQHTLIERIHVTILVIAVPTALVVIIEMLRVAFPAPKSRNHKFGLTTKPPQEYVFVGVRIPTFVSECYNLMGVYLFGLALVLIASSCSKHFTGRLAPYFMEACQPLLRNNVTACTDSSHYGHLIEDYSCSSLTSSVQLLNNMRHSFPSVHAATSSYAMLFMAIYMQVRLKTGWVKLWRCLLQFGAILIALLVALERVSSYRHHWSDVLMGILIGGIMAVFMTYSVSSLFQMVPVKVRKVRDDASNIYGYYTVMPRPRYYY